jgi:4-oxalomesaconate hydratase
MPHSEFNHFQLDTYVDIGDVFEAKIEAIRKFEAQPQLVEYYTRCGLNRGVQASDWARGRRIIKYAEGFKRYVPYLGDELPLTVL